MVRKIPGSQSTLWKPCARALRAANANAEIVVYPDAGHAFNADYRPSYHEESAKDGWQRMLAWFAQYGKNNVIALEATRYAASRRQPSGQTNVYRLLQRQRRMMKRTQRLPIVQAQIQHVTLAQIDATLHLNAQPVISHLHMLRADQDLLPLARAKALM